MRRPLHALLATVVVTFFLCPRLSAQDGASLFSDNCAACHTIGEAGGAAPDLRDVGKRIDRAWLVRFILDPEALTKAGDPHAVELAKKYDGTVMPAPGLNRESVVAILDYLDARSAGGASRPVSATVSQPLFTADDVARGGALYAGRLRLTNGGTSCLSCHDVGTGEGLGGGTLGPHLARVSVRLNGAKGISAWLSAPPTPVMRAMFRRRPLATDEVKALTAFLDDRARVSTPAAAAPGTRRFLALGVAGTLAGFVLIGIAWRDRLRPVRRALLGRGGLR